MTEFDRNFDDDPARLALRVERTLRAVKDHAGSDCPECGKKLCGHEVVYTLVIGDEKRPICLSCEARRLDRGRQELRDALTMFVQSKPCLSQGWRYASIKEGVSADAAPPCLFAAQDDVPAAASNPPLPEHGASKSNQAEPIQADLTHDAGDQGCGDLVFELRIRMNRLPPGTVLELLASDPGARTDIPAWCRLIGHQLLLAQHPRYLIRRKDD